MSAWPPIGSSAEDDRGERRKPLSGEHRRISSSVVRLTVMGPLLPCASHMPSVVRRLNKSICFGGGGIAEDVGVVDRIYTDQATRHYKSASLLSILRPC